MPHKITSTIEIKTEGCAMKHKKKKLKRHDNGTDKTDRTHSHHYKSQATSDKNRLFHSVKGNNNGVSQTVNVDVKIEQEDSCVTNCFSGLAKLFRG